MQNSNISFKSNIKVVPMDYFKKSADLIKNHVDSPWTAKQILKAEKAYTTEICDCSAGGIITGEDVVMFHLNPTEDNLNDWSNIIETLKSKATAGNKILRGFLLGRNNSRDSREVFKRLETYMKNQNIPYSKFERHKYIFADTNILYDASKDEWLITNKNLSNSLLENAKVLKELPKEETQYKLNQIVEKTFETIEIAPGDEFSFVV